MNFKFPPIVLVKVNEKPENAIKSKAKDNCVVSLIAQTIAKRKISSFFT